MVSALCVQVQASLQSASTVELIVMVLLQRPRIIAIIRLPYRNSIHYTLHRSCLLICERATVRSPSFRFLEEFEGNANISVAIKSNSIVQYTVLFLLLRYCEGWCCLIYFRDRSITVELVERAEKLGFKALVLTVDTPLFGMRRADARNKFKLPSHLRFVVGSRSLTIDLLLLSLYVGGHVDLAPIFNPHPV